MADNNKVKKTSDFNALALTETTEQHGKDINDLDERLKSLEAKLTTPIQVAAILESASADSKSLDKLFSKIFCEMLKGDKDVKEAVTEYLKQIDRKAVYSILKKWGGLLTAAVIFILGLMSSKLIDFIFSKLQ